MRKLFILVTMIVISTCLNYCDNSSTKSKNDDLDGVWYIKNLTATILATNEGLAIEFDRFSTDYFDSQIIEINGDEFNIYENDSLNTYLAINATCKIDGDLFISYQEFDGETLIDTVQFLQGDDEITFYYIINSETYGNLKYSTTYEKYDGSLPPESWLTEIPSDNYESDNSIEQSSTISVNGEIQSHTTSSGDIDWFKFTAEKDETYSINVESFGDNVLNLYDLDGSTLIAGDDDDDYNMGTSVYTECFLVWECDSTGTYYFNVTGYSNSEECYYDVEVNTIEVFGKTNNSSTLNNIQTAPFFSKNKTSKK